MNFRRQRQSELDINVTPLIDVVFLLLIFFMVSTTFSRETQLRIELPEATGEPAREEKVLDIVIDAEGNYFVNKQGLVNRKPETLQRAIDEVAGSDTSRPVRITADAKTPHQAVVTAMDVAGRLGFVHLRVATRHTPEEQ